MRHRISRLALLRCCIGSALLVVGLVCILGNKTAGIGFAATADAATSEAMCSHATYGADGNMGPLFCVIANPIALRYFAPMAKHTFALGPNASPAQVTNALVTDFKRGGTLPILCSIYQLAAWKNHWHFGVSILADVQEALHAPPGWCSEPSFNGA